MWSPRVGSVYRGQPMSYSMLKKIEAIDVEAMVERGYTILDDVLDSEKCGTFHADLKVIFYFYIIQSSMIHISHRLGNLLRFFARTSYCSSTEESFGSSMKQNSDFQNV